MLNRPPTIIEFDLEEEINEFEKMKQLRQQNPVEFYKQYGLDNLGYTSIFNLNTESIKDVNNLAESILKSNQKSDFGFGSNIREFSLEGVNNNNWSFSSIKKNEYNFSANVDEFQTPNNK